MKSLFVLATAHAQTTRSEPQIGSIRFELLPENIREVTAIIQAPDGRALARAHSTTAHFEMSFQEGNYIVVLDTPEYHKSVPVTIRRNETMRVVVVLDEKGFFKGLSKGVQNLMIKR
jgi:hypothetical protein